MNLYIVDMEAWIPFQLLEHGGFMVIKAHNEIELTDIIKTETAHYPLLKEYDGAIEKAVRKCKRFEIDEMNPVGKVKVWIT